MKYYVKNLILILLSVITITTSTQAQTWSFDDSLGGWHIANNNGVAELADFGGYSGVKLRMNELGDLIEFVNDTPPQRQQADSLWFRILSPSDRKNIEGAEFYVSYIDPDSKDTLKSTMWVSRQDLSQLNIKVKFPENDSLLQIGIKIIGLTTIGSDEFVLDFISFYDEMNTSPTLSNPTGLNVDSVGTNFAAFSWLPVEDNGLKHYRIERVNTNDKSSEYVFVDTTSGTHYIDSTVFSNTRYLYFISSVNHQDQFKRTLPQIDATTLSFPSDTTWEFEDDLNGWMAIKGNAVISGHKSFSSLHSAELTFDQQHDSIIFVMDEFLPAPDQTIFFSLFIPKNYTPDMEIGTFFTINGGTEKVYTPIDSQFIIARTWLNTNVATPRYESLQNFGLQIVSATASTDTLYVDMITTNGNYEAKPTITPPHNVEIFDRNYTNFKVRWNTPTGNGPISYYIDCISLGGRRPRQICSDFETRDTAIVIDKIPFNYGVDVYLYAIDQFGRRTFRTMVENTYLEWPTDSMSFDFEKELNHWEIEGGKLAKNDSISFSGMHSIEVVSEQDSTTLAYSIDPDGISPNYLQGHAITYKIFVSSESARDIESFTVWSVDDLDQYYADEYGIKVITPDDWTEFVHWIPDTTSTIAQFGVTIHKRDGSELSEPSIFIDFVYSSFPPTMLAKLTIPQNFTAEVNGNLVQLRWEASTGRDPFYRYYLYRRPTPIPGEEDAEFSLIKSSTSLHYLDHIPESGSYEYTLTAVNYNRLQTLSTDTLTVEIIGTANETDDNLPKVYALFNNYPNPFNPNTVISYQLPVNSTVSLKVFDLLGREVASLVEGSQEAGSYQLNFDASRLSSGMYIYRLEAGSYTETRRMMLIK